MLKTCYLKCYENLIVLTKFKNMILNFINPHASDKSVNVFCANLTYSEFAFTGKRYIPIKFFYFPFHKSFWICTYYLSVGADI